MRDKREREKGMRKKDLKEKKESKEKAGEIGRRMKIYSWMGGRGTEQVLHIDMITENRLI